MRATHYGGMGDGDIKEYLIEWHTNGVVSPSFVGFEPFKQLMELKVVCPMITLIRLYFPEKQDEHYLVVDEENLEGILANAHSGQQGLYNAEKLLSTTEAKYWEVEGLDPRIYWN